MKIRQMQTNKNILLYIELPDSTRHILKFSFSAIFNRGLCLFSALVLLIKFKKFIYVYSDIPNFYQ